MGITAVGTLDVDGAGVTIDSSTTMGITAVGNLTIDSSALSIDSVDTTNLTMTGTDGAAAKVFTIAATNANDARLELSAKTSLILQNAGLDRITLGSTNVVFDTPIQANANIQADSTAGFKFGAAGQNVTEIDIDGTFASAANTALASQLAIKTYVDTNGISGYNNILSLTTDATGVTALDVVAIDGSGNATKADASGIATGHVLGFAPVTVGASTAGCEVVQSGSLGGFGAALTAGKRYYLSETAGGVTDVAPDGLNTVVVQVGYAITDSIMAIAPMFITENN